MVLKLQSINYLLVIIRSNCSIVTPGGKNIGKIRTAEDVMGLLKKKKKKKNGFLDSKRTLKTASLKKRKT